MPTLANPDINVKLLKESRRVEKPEPLQAVADSMRWSAKCMNVECKWRDDGPYTHGEAARTVAQYHADTTGHPVRTWATVEFKGDIVRPAIEARR